MKIQNKLARYINNTTVSNKEVQLSKMVKAIALAEQELQQAQAMLTEFNATPIKEVKPVVEEVVTEYKGLDLSAPAPVTQSEYKGLDLTAPLVKEVKERMVQPKATPKVQFNKTVANPTVAFLSGPARPSNVLNSGRPSHKHNTIEYVNKLKLFIFTGIIKLAKAGVREIRVAELDGVELLTALVWESVLVKYPDMKLVVFSNGKTIFKQYKADVYEETFEIHSPYRLQQNLLKYASRVVKVDGNAFAVRRAIAKDAIGYVRIAPVALEDVTTPLYQGKTLQVNICPWTLAVEVGGDLPAVSVKADGGDYRPLQMIADEKATSSAVSETPVYKGLLL